MQVWKDVNIIVNYFFGYFLSFYFFKIKPLFFLAPFSYILLWVCHSFNKKLVFDIIKTIENKSKLHHTSTLLSTTKFHELISVCILWIWKTLQVRYSTFAEAMAYLSCATLAFFLWTKIWCFHNEGNNIKRFYSKSRFI